MLGNNKALEISGEKASEKVEFETMFLIFEGDNII